MLKATELRSFTACTTATIRLGMCCYGCLCSPQVLCWWSNVVVVWWLVKGKRTKGKETQYSDECEGWFDVIFGLLSLAKPVFITSLNARAAFPRPRFLSGGTASAGSAPAAATVGCTPGRHWVHPCADAQRTARCRHTWTAQWPNWCTRCQSTAAPSRGRSAHTHRRGETLLESSAVL